jgi:hypothetical protein
MSSFRKQLVFIFALLIIVIVGCAGPAPALEDEIEITIPNQSDWVDYGTIFEAGDEGDWDSILWGGFTATVVKREGTFHLYYQGSSDYLGAPYETVVWRAIGVATSSDGMNFTKHKRNPVLTWFPSGYPDGNGEEGATSGGVTLGVDGEILLYYGANTAISPTKVNADGRLAVSVNGFDFADAGVVLDHDDKSIWGAGDELFPIAALNDGDRWVVYYLPNSIGTGRNLGVAWGNARDDLQYSAAARSGLSNVDAWGTAGKAKVGPEIYAIFTNWVTDPRTEVRLVSMEAPDKLSEPIRTYQFEDVTQATILLDEETYTWFMYYRDEDRYGVKLAPAGSPDLTPPTQPFGVVAKSTGGSATELNWKPATDDETGIAAYKIYRNGILIETVKGLTFVDKDSDSRAENAYSIAAVNYHGTEGKRSDPESAAIEENGHLPVIAKGCY